MGTIVAICIFAFSLIYIIISIFEEITRKKIMFNIKTWIKAHKNYSICFVLIILSITFFAVNNHSNSFEPKFVYISESRKVYHIKNCFNLQNKYTKKITMDEAEKRGYEPCSDCNPCDIHSEVMVYVSSHGKKYHRENCSTIRDSFVKELSISKARESNKYYPCEICKPY